MNKVADHLRRLREEHGLSQSEFADKMGVNRMTINNYETGKRIPDIDFAVRAADFFDITVEYICGRTEFRDKDDMRTSVKTVENLAKATEKMPQRDAQLLINGLTDLFEFLYEHGIDRYMLTGAICTIDEYCLIAERFTELQAATRASSKRLLTYGVPADAVFSNEKEKVAAISDIILKSQQSLSLIMSNIGEGLVWELKRTLDEIKNPH